MLEGSYVRKFKKLEESNIKEAQVSVLIKKSAENNLIFHFNSKIQSSLLSLQKKVKSNVYRQNDITEWYSTIILPALPLQDLTHFTKPSSAVKK